MLNRVEIRRLTWSLQNIPLFYLQKLLGCFCCMFWVISICTMKRRPINFAAFGWIWADSISLYTSEFFRLLLSYVTSSLNTSNPVPLEAMHAHAITLLHHVSQMMFYALDHELFQDFSILFLLVILVQVDLNFSHPKNAFPEVVWLFQMFFWQSLIWSCLHLVVNHLYLLSWSLLLIVHFDSDMPTSWRVFFTWLYVEFFWREFSDHPPLLSSVDVQAFYCCWAH